MEKTFSTFKEFFESIKVEDVKTNIITISSSETLEEGFEVNEKKIYIK